MMPMVILAGGLATRLHPITRTIPKSLVPVCGEPFLAHQLRLLREQGFGRAVLCIGHLGDQIRAQFREGTWEGIEIAYAEDGATPLGTGGAILAAQSLLPEAFGVLYGDSYLTADLHAAAAAFRAEEDSALMCVYQNENQLEPSNVRLSGARVAEYNKRQPHPAMQHIDYGLSFFRKAALEPFADRRPLDLGEVQAALAHSGEMAAHVVHEPFFEIGSPAGLARLESHLQSHLPAP